MSVAETTLVLFDIDGTLIQTAHAGLRSLNAVFERLHGRSNIVEGVAIAGRTDRAILRDVFDRTALTWDEGQVDAVREAYFAQLTVELARPVPASGAPFGVLPGVESLLSGLERADGYRVGLLTGNFEQGARIKLGHFDLWHRFTVGAFGDEHLDRRDLVPVALSRARAAGLSPCEVVVVGDTPLDVDCAHAHGAIAVAVATGGYSTGDLVATGADLVVGTLAEVDVGEIARLVQSPR